jgi:DNA-binding CsgD family transcriptional regulator
MEFNSMNSFDLSLLSARERQICEMFAAGHKAKAIAGKLCKSDKTVYTHQARIRVKFAITTPVQWMALMRQFPVSGSV